MHCTVLQYHNGIAGLFCRPEPRKPQVAALSALRGELPGLGSSGLAARPAGKPSGILRGCPDGSTLKRSIFAFAGFRRYGSP